MKTPTGRVPSEPEMQRLPSRLHRVGQKPVPLVHVDYAPIEARALAFMGVDLSSKPDQTGFAIHTPDGIVTVVHGRRLDHEALCCAAIRARRAAEGRPPAQWVVVAYRQKLRILRHAKQLAQSRKDALSRKARGESIGKPSAS